MPQEKKNTGNLGPPMEVSASALAVNAEAAFIRRSIPRKQKRSPFK